MFMVNVGKYAIHGSYYGWGNMALGGTPLDFILSDMPAVQVASFPSHLRLEHSAVRLQRQKQVFVEPWNLIEIYTLEDWRLVHLQITHEKKGFCKLGYKCFFTSWKGDTFQSTKAWTSTIWCWTNPSEKYDCQIGSFPQVGFKINNIYIKPPPS